MATSSGFIPNVSLQDDFTFVNGLGGPGHHHRTCFPIPGDFELAPAGPNVHRGTEHPAGDPYHDRSAGAGAARKRFAASALENPQPDVVPVVDLHVTGIDPLRKA